MSDRSSTPGTGAENHPTFASERIPLDVATATERVVDALGGVTATETNEGVRFRTLDGTLLAVLSETEDGSAELQYRTAPPSETATLKARRLRRVFDADE